MKLDPPIDPSWSMKSSMPIIGGIKFTSIIQGKEWRTKIMPADHMPPQINAILEPMYADPAPIGIGDMIFQPPSFFTGIKLTLPGTRYEIAVTDPPVGDVEVMAKKLHVEFGSGLGWDEDPDAQEWFREKARRLLE